MSRSDDWQALYPFQSHYLDVGGARLHYVDEGQGEPLLLVHGNPTWSFHWRDVIRGLRDRYRVVAVDHVGCGLSDKPAEYEYSLTRHARNVERLVDALDLRGITLLAHDWGGAIGLKAVVARRARFARLVLFNTAAFRAPRMPWRIRVCRLPLLGSLGVRGLNGFARAALRMATSRPGRFTPAVRAGYLAPYDNWAHRIAIHRFVQDIPMAASHPSYKPLVELEHDLRLLATLPALFIWGLDDWCFTPWFLDRFRDIFPAAEVHGLAQAGHFVVEDAIERVLPLVESFLSRYAAADAASLPAAESAVDGASTLTSCDGELR